MRECENARMREYDGCERVEREGCEGRSLEEVRVRGYT